MRKKLRGEFSVMALILLIVLGAVFFILILPELSDRFYSSERYRSISTENSNAKLVYTSTAVYLDKLSANELYLPDGAYYGELYNKNYNDKEERIKAENPSARELNGALNKLMGFTVTQYYFVYVENNLPVRSFFSNDKKFRKYFDKLEDSAENGSLFCDFESCEDFGGIYVGSYPCEMTAKSTNCGCSYESCGLDSDKCRTAEMILSRYLPEYAAKNGSFADGLHRLYAGKKENPSKLEKYLYDNISDISDTVTFGIKNGRPVFVYLGLKNSLPYSRFEEAYEKGTHISGKYSSYGYAYTDLSDIVEKSRSFDLETDLMSFAEEGSVFSEVYPCGGNLCALYEKDRGGYALIIDPAKGECLNKIDYLPKNSRPVFIENKSGGKVCGYAAFSSSEGDSALAEIYEDGSFVISSGLSDKDVRFSCGNRRIEEKDGGLFAEGETKPFMERYSETNNPDIDFNGQSFYYSMPLDSSRFVYRAAGYESIPPFGIYDFEKEEALRSEECKNKIPIGVFNGIIYSKEAFWDGFGVSVYTTDPDTLETGFYCTSPFEPAINDIIDYFMSENCGVICAYKKGCGSPDEIALINIDDGLITRFVGPEGENFDKAFFTGRFICLQKGSIVIMAEII